MKVDAVMHARIDTATEERVVAALDAMGLSVSDETRLLVLRIAAEERLSFDVTVPAPETVEAMARLDAGEGERFV